MFGRRTDPLPEPAMFFGLEGIVLSCDYLAGSLTAVVTIPSAWQYAGEMHDGTVELFVLDGRMSVNTEDVRCGTYVHLPQGAGAVDVASASGATVVVAFNPDMPRFPPPYSQLTITKWWTEPWRATADGSHGAFHKSLRRPDFSGPDFEGGPGGFFRLVLLTPGYSDCRQHVHHECWEEALVLRGDLLLAGSGQVGLGGYFAHPQEFWHGPFVSHGGALLLTQTDAPMGKWEFREDLHGEELVGEHLDSTPWTTVPVQAPWSDSAGRGLGKAEASGDERRREPHTRRDAWAADVGREMASRFRASLRRQPADDRRGP
jgi:hypothetical protein